MWHFTFRLEHVYVCILQQETMTWLVKWNETYNLVLVIDTLRLSVMNVCNCNGFLNKAFYHIDISFKWALNNTSLFRKSLFFYFGFFRNLEVWKSSPLCILNVAFRGYEGAYFLLLMSKWRVGWGISCYFFKEMTYQSCRGWIFFSIFFKTVQHNFQTPLLKSVIFMQPLARKNTHAANPTLEF